MAIMLITHDLGVAAQMADEVAVMYLGEVVEHGPAASVLASRKHPYTQALLGRCRGSGNAAQDRLAAVRGTVPPPYRTAVGLPVPSALRRVHGWQRADLTVPDAGAACDDIDVACLLYGEEDR